MGGDDFTRTRIGLRVAIGLGAVVVVIALGVFAVGVILTGEAGIGPPPELADDDGPLTDDEIAALAGSLTEAGVPEDAAGRIEPGVYTVGDEIAPGQYRTEVAWATFDGDGNRRAVATARDGVLLVYLDEDDVTVQFLGDTVPLSELPTVDPVALGFDGGSYLIGDDIPVGTYRVRNLDADPHVVLYDDALRGSSIVIDQEDSDVIVTLTPEDHAVEYRGSITPVG